MGVVYMEVDKVADEVADMVVHMEVDKVADMLVKIPDEDYWCDWQLVILMEKMVKKVKIVLKVTWSHSSWHFAYGDVFGIYSPDSWSETLKTLDR